ncbi:MAG: MarR family transcriptional regulator [Pseudohongiellaceae bacterium]
MNNRLEDVLIALRRVNRATDLHSKYLAKTTGLTTPQMLLLQSVSNKGPVTIGALANEISLGQATVTAILDRLENRGLVTRVRSTEDKRRVHIHLTDAAANLLQHAPVPLQRQFAEQFGALQGWEQTMIVSALQRVAQMMDADELEASPLLHAGAMHKPEEAG